MKIRTSNSTHRADGDVLVAPTFTTGYRRDLEVARRVIGQRRGGAGVSEGPAPKRARSPVPCPEPEPAGP